MNRVDNIVIQFGSTFQHLGRICYKNFQVTNKNNRKFNVDIDSIDVVAIQFAKKLIPYLADLKLYGIRGRTLSGFTSFIISLFKYIRKNGLNLLCNKTTIRNIIHSYTDNLLHQIKV